ncbi:MAG TPA: VWA domain-containing protein [Kineosporiaceae bacterium]|nr:VWA domain-containing protein [Kineosporiaceae bacterium]
MSDLSFEAPVRLLLLLGVAAVALAYVLVQRRRQAYAVRFTDVDLLASVAPKVPGWRRHLSALLLLGALVLMTGAFAKPAAAVEVPQEAATIIVAIDTSASMAATDVSPDRFTAAQEAAANFVNSLPDSFDVALVSFSQTAAVDVSPTEDHDSVVTAIKNLQMGQGTAIGEAVAASVATAGQTPDEDGKTPPARVVLLSDGSNTQGRSIEDAISVATAASVPVSTIAYGTAEGTVTVQGRTLSVPVDAAALEELATATGGQHYAAESSDELSDVYDDISKQVGTTTERREISAGFAGLALLASFGAAAASLAWSPRLP